MALEPEVFLILDSMTLPFSSTRNASRTVGASSNRAAVLGQSGLAHSAVGEASTCAGAPRFHSCCNLNHAVAPVSFNAAGLNLQRAAAWIVALSSFCDPLLVANLGSRICPSAPIWISNVTVPLSAWRIDATGHSAMHGRVSTTDRNARAGALTHVIATANRVRWSKRIFEPWLVVRSDMRAGQRRKQAAGTVANRGRCRAWQSGCRAPA
jgi:hypothetical protein